MKSNKISGPAKILKKAQNIDLVWLSLKKSCSCYAPVSDWEYSDMFLNMFKTFLTFQKCPRHILACQHIFQACCKYALDMSIHVLERWVLAQIHWWMGEWVGVGVWIKFSYCSAQANQFQHPSICIIQDFVSMSVSEHHSQRVSEWVAQKVRQNTTEIPE